MLPNFYIAGGARCGSTSLFAYCKAHPQIFMAPIKEPNYFSYGYGGIPFAGPGRERFYAPAIKDRRTYEAMFEGAGDALAVGEASINYMLHPEACAGIRALTPDARLLFVLRQPVERAWSSFQRSRHEGTEKEPDFLAAWHDDERRRAAGHWSSIHRYKSLYGRHLKVWFETFPREQIKVVLFDDILADSAAVMRDVLRVSRCRSRFRAGHLRRIQPVRGDCESCPALALAGNGGPAVSPRPPDAVEMAGPALSLHRPEPEGQAAEGEA